ncbi:hypothetical protein GGX14DRAFT_438590 [Mycena pura]|uniref:Uncharacterized protein n=1 Tax=Mycena pura TaxID=153505 RepID=A0AAD6VR13_9AGAR|nr:hypothetical protein GGX14DRAFT_438590 [Mycena pura]
MAFLFVIFRIPIVTATNMSMVLAMRFMTGFFGSPALATGVCLSVERQWLISSRNTNSHMFWASGLSAPSRVPLRAQSSADSQRRPSPGDGP